MSLLYLRARPIVSFNANDPAHRAYYKQFLETQSWGKCPVRFMVESLNTDLVTYINREMLTWYVQSEFYNAKDNNQTTKTSKPKSSRSRGTVHNKLQAQGSDKQTPVQTQA